jgi:DNA-binding response OmpR family regulator
LIPTIVLSASADPHAIRKAYFLGANFYLRKPQGFEELQALLNLFYRYWAQCEVPQVLETWEQAETHCAGKLGQRYSSWMTFGEFPLSKDTRWKGSPNFLTALNSSDLSELL